MVAQIFQLYLRKLAQKMGDGGGEDVLGRINKVDWKQVFKII